MFEGELEQGVWAFEVKFEGDVGAVTVYGADADEEFVGNLVAGLVVGHQFQHAPLGVSQGAESGLLFRLVERAAAIEQVIGHPKAALEYAGRLKSLRDRVADRLLVLMRVYFE